MIYTKDFDINHIITCLNMIQKIHNKIFKRLSMRDNSQY